MRTVSQAQGQLADSYVQSCLHVGKAVWYPVGSNSMFPIIPTHSRVLLQARKPGLPAVGDVVVLESRGRLCAHRVIDTNTAGGQTTVTTKGDLGEGLDVPRPPEDIIAMCAGVRLPWLGWEVTGLRWQRLQRGFWRTTARINSVLCDKNGCVGRLIELPWPRLLVAGCLLAAWISLVGSSALLDKAKATWAQMTRKLLIPPN